MTDDGYASTVAHSRGRVGTVGQIARIDQFIATGGSENGTRVIRLVNGGGLELEIHPDRAFDLGRVTFGGIPIAWMSPAGMAAPGLADTDGFGWLKTFGGGLLATCGLDTIGDPSIAADGKAYPLHGRFGALPATLTRAVIDGEELILEAETRQAAVHGENLVVRRSLTSAIGSDSFRLTDTVTNEGGTDQPHMILYHLNLGWPLISPATRFSSPALSVTPDNEDARATTEHWSTITEPDAESKSLVFRHHLAPKPRTVVSVINPDTGVSVMIGFDSTTLPHLHQWKVMQKGQYVVGIEPSNCATLKGRVPAEELGLVPTLAAGASVTYQIDFTFSAGAETAQIEAS
jgi:hypothetical protein